LSYSYVNESSGQVTSLCCPPSAIRIPKLPQLFADRVRSHSKDASDRPHRAQDSQGRLALAYGKGTKPIPVSGSTRRTSVSRSCNLLGMAVTSCKWNARPSSLWERDRNSFLHFSSNSVFDNFSGFFNGKLA